MAMYADGDGDDYSDKGKVREEHQGPERAHYRPCHNKSFDLLRTVLVGLCALNGRILACSRLALRDQARKLMLADPATFHVVTYEFRECALHIYFPKPHQIHIQRSLSLPDEAPFAKMLPVSLSGDQAFCAMMRDPSCDAREKESAIVKMSSLCGEAMVYFYKFLLSKQTSGEMAARSTFERNGEGLCITCAKKALSLSTLARKKKQGKNVDVRHMMDIAGDIVSCHSGQIVEHVTQELCVNRRCKRTRGGAVPRAVFGFENFILEDDVSDIITSESEDIFEGISEEEEPQFDPDEDVDHLSVSSSHSSANRPGKCMRRVVASSPEESDGEQRRLRVAIGTAELMHVSRAVKEVGTGLEAVKAYMGRSASDRGMQDMIYVAHTCLAPRHALWESAGSIELPLAPTRGVITSYEVCLTSDRGGSEWKRYTLTLRSPEEGAVLIPDDGLGPLLSKNDMVDAKAYPIL